MYGGELQVVTNVFSAQGAKSGALKSFLVVCLDKPDGGNRTSGKLRELRESFLYFFEPEVQFRCQNLGGDGENRHWQDGNQCKLRIYVNHEADCRRGHDNGIGESDQTHAACQLN